MLADTDHPTIHHLAYNASHDSLIRKTVTDRIYNNLINMGEAVKMKYY